MTAVTEHQSIDLEVHFSALTTAAGAGMRLPARFDTYVSGTDDEAADHFTVVMANLDAMGVRYKRVLTTHSFGVEFDNGMRVRSVHIRDAVVAAHLGEAQS